MDSKGGLAVGNSHAEGGIKATVKSTNQNIEFEGGEVIVNKKNVADETLLEFEGEKKTTCEILSDLNSRNNNGVTLDCDSVEGKKYKFEKGGQVQFIDYKDKEIMFEPNYEEYFVDDEQFKTLEEAQAFIDSGSPISDWKKDAYRKGMFEDGGSVSDSENINYEDWKINNKKNVFAKNGVKLPEIHYPENSLGIPRHELPQVQTNYIQELVSDLQEDNIDFNYLLLNPKDLKPCQKEINLHKVNNLTDEYLDKKYIIVSNDGYVLDGHHSWYCCCQKDKKIKALQIDMPIKKLIDYLHKFRFVEYETIDSPSKLFKNGGNVDDLGHSEKLVKEVMTKLVPKPQLAYLNELKRQGGEDAVEMEDVLINVIEAYKYMPNIYEQDGKGYNAVVRIHYFVGGTDWYITEMDKITGEMYGFTVLNGDYEMAEFGYIDSEFLIDNNLPPLSKPQLDFYWNYQTINEILEREEPSMVRPPIVRYQEQKTTTEKITLISKDWQALIKENKFKNPFDKVKAIEEMIDEKGDNPDNYSIIEKNFISQYTGIGGMEKYGAKMRDVGKGKDLDFGLLYEFFTPNDLARLMWGLAYKYQGKLTIKNVLEPSMGAGAFISQAPLNVNVDGYDINKYCYIINKVLHIGERFNFYHESFEKLFISKNSSVEGKVKPMYDLVIGNPPYGEYKGYYSAMGEKKYTSANDYIDYFISRGLDILVPNGLLVFIIGSVSNLGGVPFLDKKMTKSKSKIMSKCELVDAYRLGRNMFEFTEVDADIIVLRKK